MTGYLAIWLISVVLIILEFPGGLASAIAPVLSYHVAIGLLAGKTAGKGYVLDNSTVATPPVAPKDNNEILSQEP